MKTFNHIKLRILIVESGKTQNEIAEALGVHHNTVSGWVNSTAPRPEILFNILRVLGVSYDEVLGYRLVDWYPIAQEENKSTDETVVQRVYGNALIDGDARVYGDAQVSNDARVYGVKEEES